MPRYRRRRPSSTAGYRTANETSDGGRTPFGIGWQVATGPGERRMMVSGGSAIGGTTVLFVFPDDGVVVVFVTNMGNAPIRGVPLNVARILLGEPEGSGAPS